MPLLVALVFPLFSIAESGTELQPVAPWSVEYATNMCVLSRGFGGTMQQPDVTLAVRPLPLSTRAEMVVATPLDTKVSAKPGKVKVTLLPAGQEREVSFTRRRNDTVRRTLTTLDVPTDVIDGMRDAKTIEFAVKGEPSLRLPIGSAGKALTALTPCQDDLLRTWGYDPAIKDRIGKAAEPMGGNLGTFFGRDYYPSEALRLNQQGRAIVAWTITADGRTKDCRILGSSGVPSLDMTTCAILLQKIRFKPALDRESKPMASYQTMAVRWSLD